jgi:hypothetical protein
MQVPDRKTPVTRCESLSRYAESALLQYIESFDPTAEEQAQLRANIDQLFTARTGLATKQADYRTAVLDCITPRVAVAIVDLRADGVTRSAKRAADEAGKDVAAMVFPEGVTPIVKLFGQSEVDSLIALEGRIAAAAGRWSEAAAMQTRIIEARTRYEAALANRTTALNLAASKRALRNSAKEDFLDTYAKVASAIKGLFPRDKTLQDVFFDEVRSAGSEGDGEDEAG